MKRFHEDCFFNTEDTDGTELCFKIISVFSVFSVSSVFKNCLSAYNEGPQESSALTQPANSESAQELLAEFKQLWSEAEKLWDERQNQPAWHSYVSADFEAVFNTLYEMRGMYSTFLEWGSGLGVVTIMASRLGFEAYGIEAEARLVEHSQDFAEFHAPEATFAEGSFIPTDYDWDPESGGDVYRSSIGSADAYDQLGMEIQDFDLIYCYPWPDEHPLLHAIIRQFGRPDTTLITYDACEGMAVTRVNQDS